MPSVSSYNRQSGMYILYNKSGDGSGSQFLCYKKNLCHSKTNVYEHRERKSETRKQFRDSLEHITDKEERMLVEIMYTLKK